MDVAKKGRELAYRMLRFRGGVHVSSLLCLERLVVGDPIDSTIDCMSMTA